MLQGDADALRSAAPALNKFAGDGSFLDNALAGSGGKSKNPLQDALRAGQEEAGSPTHSSDSHHAGPLSDDGHGQNDSSGGAATAQDHAGKSGDAQRHQGHADEFQRQAADLPSAHSRRQGVANQNDRAPRAEAAPREEAADAADAPARMPTAGPDASEGGNKSAAAALRARLLVGPNLEAHLSRLLEI